MPLYEMQDVKTKHVEEVFFHMADVPELGKVVKVAGRKMRRCVTAPQTMGKPSINFTAISLPRARMGRKGWEPPGDAGFYPPDQKYDAKGNPCFSSKRSLDEFLARSEGAYAYGID